MAGVSELNPKITPQIKIGASISLEMLHAIIRLIALEEKISRVGTNAENIDMTEELFNLSFSFVFS